MSALEKLLDSQAALYTPGRVTGIEINGRNR
jgi:hypothetical protein